MTLRAKILSFVLSSSFLAVGLIIWMTRNSVDDILIDQITRMGLSEIVDLSEKSVEGIKTKHEISLLKLLGNSQNTTHANYVMALDKTGLVLAHTNVVEKDKTYQDPLSRELLRANSPQVRVQMAGLNSTVELSAPVWDRGNFDSTDQLLLGSSAGTEGKERVGTVRLNIPLSDVLMTRNKIVRRIAGIMTLIGCVAILLTVFMINGILRPIRLLMRGTAQISSGEYGTQIPVLSRDELGALASNFNRMSGVLAETTVSKDFLSGILEKMQDALMIIDDGGRLRMVNRACANFLGYGENELIGNPMEIIFANKKTAPKINVETALDLAQSSKNVEVDFLTKKGDRVPVLYSLSKFNDKGEWLLVARDVGERKRMEEVLRRSDKMSAVGQLAAGVAHEINNPLGVILGFAQASVRRLQKNDPLEMPLKSIENEAIRCKNLVQDLLTFSRVSKTEREPVDLNQAIESSLSLVTTKAKMAKVNVTKDLSNSLPRILGNSNQVQQVLINLANNALDAMPGGGTLHVKTENLAEGPLSWVRICVIDSGTGIPPEILNRIFEPFFTTKGVGKGTGLGLSLVHEIVKKHSGTIEVQSRPGCTEFLVKLPVRTGPPTFEEKNPKDQTKT